MNSHNALNDENVGRTAISLHIQRSTSFVEATSTDNTTVLREQTARIFSCEQPMRLATTFHHQFPPGIGGPFYSS